MNDPSLDPARRFGDVPSSTVPDSDATADQPPAQPLSRAELAARRRELELELARIRSEASAARLQARAAELELMIRRLSRLTEPPPQASGAADPGVLASSATESSVWNAVPFKAKTSDSSTANRAPQPASQGDGSAPLASGRESERRRANVPCPNEAAAGNNAAATKGSPRAAERNERNERNESKAGGKRSAAGDARGREKPASEKPHTKPASEKRHDEPASGKRSDAGGKRKDEGGKRGAAEPWVQPSSDDQPPRQRKRPTPWLLSAAAHAALFIFLGAMTLSAQRPKDQVALSAAASEPQPTPMETFSIETPQPEPQPEQPTAAPVDAELSPVGELAAAELELDAPPAPPAADTAEMLRGAGAAASAAAQLTSETTAQTQFCGVDGGGNHFVYLVDSSGSMGEAFASARAELLRSIDQLGPEQRFYVIFFDAEPDYMRLSTPDRDEPASVVATPEHKQKLRRWAMQVAINPGRAPYEPLRFALELRPDVIFLLSDGEFPESIERLLREENRVENLFGDGGPLSIVHTIGYHSREGESRMRAIAQANGGQYRHVPAP